MTAFLMSLVMSGCAGHAIGRKRYGWAGLFVGGAVYFAIALVGYVR